MLLIMHKSYGLLMKVWHTGIKLDIFGGKQMLDRLIFQLGYNNKQHNNEPPHTTDSHEELLSRLVPVVLIPLQPCLDKPLILTLH
ncbi:hypothetical protein GCM10023116_07560 [Kistimonas scapharcae]|uniref:Uncharacterized protein n=1 Tax=Kistimonas scapharcae TaxID=1036133 RepID=A0ABP8UXZ9_9GAMM